MTGPSANLLNDGKRLHLQHGPIDLIVGVNGNHQAVFEVVAHRFKTVLQELVSELSELRMQLQPTNRIPNGEIAKRMHNAALPYCEAQFVTPMAGVAGAVADEILNAIQTEFSLNKVYVNNGGDIAICLKGEERFTTLISSYDGIELGRISLTCADKVGGIATSGRCGRSLSLGIADSVTVLAENAAQADVAATLIANVVNLPDHPVVKRERASDLDPDSDLGDQMVVVDCGPLSQAEISYALDCGMNHACELLDDELIKGAALFLRGEHRLIGNNNLEISERIPDYA